MAAAAAAPAPAAGSVASGGDKLWFEEPDKHGGVSLVEELEKLTELHDQGVLESDEFEALKASLLGLAPAPAPAATAPRHHAGGPHG